MEASIPRRISAAILGSLSSGTVPRIGLEYIAVGRKREIETVLGDLENINQGAGVFRFVSGRYGGGKTFFLQAIRNYGMDQDFLVADADLSPEKRLAGSAKQGLETYRELIQRLSTKTRPDGGALEAILQGWINTIKLDLIKEGTPPDDPKLSALVEYRIYETSSALENMTHGFDFAQAVSCYFKALIAGDDERGRGALRWLRGEFASRTEARKVLPVGEIITAENWYEYLKLFAAFASVIGYRGLLVFIDECANLYKISNRQARENNYEKLLSMYNDATQGKVQHLGLYLAGTPNFIRDERRGLWSYPAFKSRLRENRFAQEGRFDFTGPILPLEQLSREEILILLERLRDIHAGHYGYHAALGERELIAFLEFMFAKPGSEEFLTPREITRDFLGLLNILMEDPEETFEGLLQKNPFQADEDKDEDDYASFDI